MGERKVLNKYYPPDFDPSKLGRAKKQHHHRQIKVRMMLPFSLRCDKCGNHIGRGTKFNCRKETVKGQSYLGLQIFQFYFNCTNCSAEFSIKTDPKNSDYAVAFGAHGTHHHPPQEKTISAMNSLENNRRLESKREMEISAGLEELISLKARQASVGFEAAFDALPKADESDDEALIKSIVFCNDSKRQKVSNVPALLAPKSKFLAPNLQRR